MINKKNIIRLCRVHCFWQCSDFCISHCLLCWDWVSFSFDLCWNTWRVSLEWRGIWFSHWIWKALKIVLSQTRTTFLKSLFQYVRCFESIQCFWIWVWFKIWAFQLLIIHIRPLIHLYFLLPFVWLKRKCRKRDGRPYLNKKINISFLVSYLFSTTKRFIWET